MSEMGGDYDPGPWRGYDFKSARKPAAVPKPAFDPTGGRGYDPIDTKSKKSTAKMTLDQLVPVSLSTNCKSPVVVVVDGTGSMEQFPETMFKKLPLLDKGIEDYLEDCEFSFAMIGDAVWDNYPLQVQPFRKGKGLVESLNNLIIEHGGGANEQESYDLAALYYARNVQMPKAVNPILIYVCDEGIYPSMSKDWAKDHARVDLDKALKTAELFEELKGKYSVYCIRKHYQGLVQGEKMVGSNLKIHQQWEQYVGADHITILNDPNRVVDLIFGIAAYHTGKTDFFQKEIEFRQKPEQVDVVVKSMVTLGKAHASSRGHGGKSIVVRPPSVAAKNSKSLL